MRLIGNTSENKAVDRRRIIANNPMLINCLRNDEDKAIFFAATKKQVHEMSDSELVEKSNMLVKVIVSDVGLKQATEHEVIRFTEIIKKYYSGVSLQEIKIAFEMASVGRLDDYLPLDRNGQPDKNHYQSFSIDYISKILNAYLKRRNETEDKIYTALPNGDIRITSEMKEFYNRERKKTIITSFLSYKYRGKLPDNVNSSLIYAEIDRLGMAEPIQVTEADKKEAVARLLRKAHTGLINEFVAQCIRYQQTSHYDVNPEAGLIAEEKALIKSFEIMAKEEIQITDYITLK